MLRFLLVNLAAVVGLVAISGTSAQQGSSVPEVHPKILAFLKPVDVPVRGDELQKKLRERHNVAVKLLEERVNEYKKGVRDVSSVFEAARLTVDAKLEIAETKEARTEVLEQTLDVTRLVETQLDERLKKGFGSKSDLERARLARLTAEVELLRAKGKDIAPPK